MEMLSIVETSPPWLMTPNSSPIHDDLTDTTSDAMPHSVRSLYSDASLDETRDRATIYPIDTHIRSHYLTTLMVS